MDRLNELLKKVSCDETCQRDKELAILKQQMIDAEVNIDTAPQQLANTKKKYYTLLKGLASYNEMRDEELSVEADTLVKTLKEKLQRAVIGYHNRYSQHTTLSTSLAENKKYLKLLSDPKSPMKTLSVPLDQTIQFDAPDNSTINSSTLARVLEYERQKYTSARSYYNYLAGYYAFAAIIVTIMRLMSDKFSVTQSVVIGLVVVLYPICIPYILTFIIFTFTYIKSYIPRNMYLGEISVIN
jgi:hypothetical protein